MTRRKGSIHPESTAYRSKIGRLPHGLREELNANLRDGMSGVEALKWLNALSEMKAMGEEINNQNLSDWRHSGYSKWLIAQKFTPVQPCQQCERKDKDIIWYQRMIEFIVERFPIPQKASACDSSQGEKAEVGGSAGSESCHVSHGERIDNDKASEVNQKSRTSPGSDSKSEWEPFVQKKPFDLQDRVDPIKESFNALIVVLFTKSTSKNYGLALSVARGASRYAETNIDGTIAHVAVFGRTREDAGKALAVTELVVNLKGTLFFTNGKVASFSYELVSVLKCYLEATACADYRAHCHIVIDDPRLDEPKRSGGGLSINLSLDKKPPLLKKIQVDRYSFPCQYLHPQFKFQQAHPSTLPDQIQARAVERGCDICPFFNPGDFKKVGEKSVLVDLFEH